MVRVLQCPFSLSKMTTILLKFSLCSHSFVLDSVVYETVFFFFFFRSFFYGLYDFRFISVNKQ